MGGPHLVLYCFEPEDLAHPTTSGRHLAFVQQGLADLDAQWAEWAKEGRMPTGLRTRFACSFPRCVAAFDAALST